MGVAIWGALVAIALALVSFYDPIKRIATALENQNKGADDPPAGDFRAPKGKYRIIKEHMSDGKLEVLCDTTSFGFASSTLSILRDDNDEDVFTVCDENGVKMT